MDDILEDNIPEKKVKIWYQLNDS